MRILGLAELPASGSFSPATISLGVTCCFVGGLYSPTAFFPFVLPLISLRSFSKLNHIAQGQISYWYNLIIQKNSIAFFFLEASPSTPWQETEK